MLVAVLPLNAKMETAQEFVGGQMDMYAVVHDAMDVRVQRKFISTPVNPWGVTPRKTTSTKECMARFHS